MDEETKQALFWLVLIVVFVVCAYFAAQAWLTGGSGGDIIPFPGARPVPHMISIFANHG